MLLFLRPVGCWYATLFFNHELVSRANLCLVSVFPDIVKDCPKTRNLPKTFLRSFENVAPWCRVYKHQHCTFVVTKSVPYFWTMLDRRRFSVAAPHVSNSLPVELTTDYVSLHAFKNNLNTFLQCRDRHYLARIRLLIRIRGVALQNSVFTWIWRYINYKNYITYLLYPKLHLDIIVHTF